MTEYILPHEWARLVPDEAKNWWQPFSSGLIALKGQHPGLAVKFTARGFVHIQFRDVGISNSQVWRGRNHVSIGCEQSSKFEKRRARFKPLVENWITGRGWGEPTSTGEAIYRQKCVLDSDCPAPEQILGELAELLDVLASSS